MIDYLGTIKKKFSQIFALYHFSFTLIAVIFILITLQEASLPTIFSIEIIYLCVSAIFYFLIKNIIKKYIVSTLGSQETISRSFFKNTRLVINNISHEIRTPLNAIMGFADDLCEIEKDDKKLESLLAIKVNSDRLFNIAKKLIDFSAIETGQFNIDREFISIDSISINLQNKYQEEIELKGLELIVNNRVPPNYRINTDYNALFEILEMLLENAIKFTDKGSIIINSYYEKGSLHYSVCDTGCGVPDDKKELIFQLYRQGNSNLDREYEGIGLGLTIAEKLTEILGGSIELVNDDKVSGTCFHIQLNESFKEIKNDHTLLSIPIFADKYNIDEYNAFKESTLALSEYVKVFNPDEIRKIAKDLEKRGDIFKDLSHKLIETADTFNESEFSQIVGEMLKGIKNED